MYTQTAFWGGGGGFQIRPFREYEKYSLQNKTADGIFWGEGGNSRHALTENMRKTLYKIRRQYFELTLFGQSLVCTFSFCDIRGCPHIMSANFRGFQTPPPPLVINRQQLPDPPPPPRQQSSAFAWPPLTPSSAFVILWPTPPLLIYSRKNTIWYDIERALW